MIGGYVLNKVNAFLFCISSLFIICIAYKINILEHTARNFVNCALLIPPQLQSLYTINATLKHVC